VVCLIGASGSGKSTLLKAINLLVPIDSGRIVLDGLVITDEHINANEGPLEDGHRLPVLQPVPPHVGDRQHHPRPPQGAGRVHTRGHGRGENLLERFGLADKRDEYPERLSGGEQQRVAIVRALAMEPELLLLDEVTSALDPVLVGEVLALIRELKDAGMTMVIATHEMGFARETADRVAFLHGGKVWEDWLPGRALLRPPATRDPGLPPPHHAGRKAVTGRLGAQCRHRRRPDLGCCSTETGDVYFGLSTEAEVWWWDR
jgi:polar amino acid transport system ATP-binding protein